MVNRVFFSTAYHDVLLIKMCILSGAVGSGHDFTKKPFLRLHLELMKSAFYYFSYFSRENKA